MKVESLRGVRKADVELYVKARSQEPGIADLERAMENFEGRRFEADSDTIYNYAKWMHPIRSLVGWGRGEHWAWKTAADFYRRYSADVPSVFQGAMKPIMAWREDGTEHKLTQQDIEEWERCEKESDAERQAFQQAEKAAGRGWLFDSPAYDAVTDVLDAYWNELARGVRS